MPRRQIQEAGEADGPPSVSPPNEIGLIVRVAGGDTSAFEALFRRYHPRLRRFLERMTRRPQLVEEVLNDTMFMVWRKAHTYNFSSKVSTWIFGIAFRRGLKALKKLDDAIDFDFDEAAAPVESGPENQLQRQELRAVLDHAMTALSVQHRTVIELTYNEGHTYREIAEIMGCPVDTVKTRMFHARRRLKALLADEGGDVR